MTKEPLIFTLPSGIFATNAYLLACLETKKAAIIDPGQESTGPVLNYLRKQDLNPEKILLTHSHMDHIADVKALKVACDNIPVYIHGNDAPNLRNPGSDGLPLMFTVTPCEPDVFINDGDVIEVGNIKLQVIHTPGHSPGGVCFYDAKNHLLFSGDTLFQGTIGNLSFPTSNPSLMWLSLKKLATLPLETKVFPGHGPSTTIGEESWLSEAQKHFG